VAMVATEWEVTMDTTVHQADQTMVCSKSQKMIGITI